MLLPFWPFLSASYTAEGVGRAEEAREGDGRQIPARYLHFTCLLTNFLLGHRATRMEGDAGPDLGF